MNYIRSYLNSPWIKSSALWADGHEEVEQPVYNHKRKISLHVLLQTKHPRNVAWSQVLIQTFPNPGPTLGRPTWRRDIFLFCDHPCIPCSHWAGSNSSTGNSLTNSELQLYLFGLKKHIRASLTVLTKDIPKLLAFNPQNHSLFPSPNIQHSKITHSSSETTWHLWPTEADGK